MTLNFSRTGDDTILEHITAIDLIGADVVVQTTEDSENKGSLTRFVTISWQTHTTTGRVLA